MLIVYDIDTVSLVIIYVVVVIIGKKEEDCVDKYVGVSKEFDDVAKQVGKVVDDVTAVKEEDCGYTTFTINK